MGDLGGSTLVDILTRQRLEIEDYYGAINEIKMGVRTKAPERPGLLEAVDLVDLMGIPLVAGGVLDQPHIWLLQYQMVKGIQSIFEAQDQMAQNSAA